ncbi:MAG TPA: M1 family metallopeptidase [Candidatus Sulfotelmatobacter sp.]|nr:M1 family metallopeptidase [Candidatus Sulfotelmatobacter sp.]
MKLLRLACLLACAAFLAAGSLKAAAQTADKAGPAAKAQPLSTRVVAYEIEARLDPAKKSIQASEVLTYHNLTGQPQQTFPFHLYLNAFQPQSTFMTESHRDDPGFEWKPAYRGSIRITRLEVAGMGDLTDRMQFVHPDDSNADDRTVMQVELPKPIPPGGDVQFKISFEDQMPRVVARTGYVRDFFMVGQWFPKVGVWWKGAWNCHQFHETTEFFADFGTFDVKLTVPQGEIVGAGGDLISAVSSSDGTKTLTYHSEDVHDFSWTASPHFQVVEDTWTGSGGTVKIHVLMSPGHDRTTARYLEALKGTLQAYDEWIGPYPYDRITVVDPPHGGLEAGGMEYPTLVTADTAWWMPKRAYVPELVLVHEFGHQYWYGMVATNEFEEAWLDEGINSYLEAKVMDHLYGKETSVFQFRWTQLGEDAEQRRDYLRVADMDPLTRFGWKFQSDSAYGGISYGKTASVLLTLEKIIGEKTLMQALHAYFLRYRFTHPTGEDFLKTVEEVSGKNLRWYFDQAVYGTNILDYEILDVQSDPVNWYEEDERAAKPGSRLFRNYVTVHRKGDFIFPVDLAVKFDDGQTAREHWDGRDRWVRYTHDRPAEIVSAEIDPEHQILLDRDLFNNSYRVEADKRAVRKLSNIWIFLTQWLAQCLAWLT